MTNQRLLLTDTFETWAKKFNGALDDIDTAIENIPSLDKLAPKNHASEENIYGIGNASLFGHVKLSDAIDSESNVENGVGATPAAVKKAYDKATTEASLSQKGIVKLNNTIDSDSTTDAATPSAVKKAYDKASEVFTGSTGGRVPSAKNTDAKKVLFGDGTWKSIEDDTAIISVSENYYLTENSPQAIIMTVTTTNLSLFLPNHSLVQKGTTFRIWLKPGNDIRLCDYSGNAIISYPVLKSNSAVLLQLIDEINGVWAIGEYNVSSTSDNTSDTDIKFSFSLGELQIITTTKYEFNALFHLSETKAILFYKERDGTYYPLKYTIITKHETDITLGEEKTVDLENSLLEISTIEGFYISQISNNKYIIFSMKNGSSRYRTMYTCILTLDNENIIAGTTQTFSLDSTDDYKKIKDVILLSENKIVLSCTVSTMLYYFLFSINEDITNISYLTYYRISNSNINLSVNNACIKISDSKLLVLYANNTLDNKVHHTDIYAKVLSITDNNTISSSEEFNTSYNFYESSISLYIQSIFLISNNKYIMLLGALSKKIFALPIKYDDKNNIIIFYNIISNDISPYSITSSSGYDDFFYTIQLSSSKYLLILNARKLESNDTDMNNSYIFELSFDEKNNNTILNNSVPFVPIDNPIVNINSLILYPKSYPYFIMVAFNFSNSPYYTAIRSIYVN